MENLIIPSLVMRIQCWMIKARSVNMKTIDGSTERMILGGSTVNSRQLRQQQGEAVENRD